MNPLGASDGAAGQAGVKLRPFRAGDIDALYEIQSEPEGMALVGAKARTREEFKAAWERNQCDPLVCAFAIQVAGDEPIVGCISRFRANERECVGYWIARDHWGKGVASAALRLFLAGEPRRPLCATTARSNAASRRVLEKCGFRCVSTRSSPESARFLAREVAEYVLE